MTCPSQTSKVANFSDLLKWIREALKKIRKIFRRLGGGSNKKNFTVFKVMFKIHFRSILSHFSPIFGFRKFLQVFDISRGQFHVFFFLRLPLGEEKSYTMGGGWKSGVFQKKTKQNKSFYLRVKL